MGDALGSLMIAFFFWGEGETKNKKHVFFQEIIEISHSRSWRSKSVRWHQLTAHLDANWQICWTPAASFPNLARFGATAASSNIVIGGINLVKVWVHDILMHVSLLDHVVLHGFYEGGREWEKEAIGMMCQKFSDKLGSFYGIYIYNSKYMYEFWDMILWYYI